MTDRYEKIRQALAMGPTPGPLEQDGDGVLAVNEDIAVAMCCPSDADRAFISACHPGTIWALLEEPDALAAEIEALRAEVDALREALECMIIGACAVAVPHNGERAVLQDAVNIARAALDAYRKGGKQ